jgi:beta-lactam-binding protein with PASTA domain
MWGAYMRRIAERYEPQGFPSPPEQRTLEVPAIPPFDVLTDQVRAELEAAFRAAGFTLLFGETEDWRSAGAFVSQSPSPGTTVTAGSAITVLVSTGTGEAPPLPDVRGQVYADAAKFLQSLGYKVTREDVVVQEESAYGRVIAMSPQAGTRVKPDGTDNARVILKVGVPPALNGQPFVPLP